MKRTLSNSWFQPKFAVEINENLNGKQNVSNRNNNTRMVRYVDWSCNVSDLAVNKKKVAEVEEWLRKHVLSLPPKSQASILLLTGPSGAGKTATIRAVCRATGFNIDIVEWITPTTDFDPTLCDLNLPGQTTRFIEFLTQATRYPSLIQTNARRKIVLVEDFPNSVVHNPTEFGNVLEVLMQCGSTPVVFICSDSVKMDANRNLAQRLFPDAIRITYSITTINFNPVSKNLMKLALTRTLESMDEQCSDTPTTLPSAMLETITEICAGDIRCAINSLYFACAKIPDSNQSPKTNNKRKRTKTKTIHASGNKLETMYYQRNETVDLFHGVGRVLHPKLDVHSPGSVADQFETVPELFVSFLYENYLSHFDWFEDVRDATEVLSAADMYFRNSSTNFHNNNKELGLMIAVAGMMCANKHPARKWNPIYGLKFTKRRNDDRICEDNKIHPTDSYYYNIIKGLNCFNKYFTV